MRRVPLILASVLSIASLVACCGPGNVKPIVIKPVEKPVEGAGAEQDAIQAVKKQEGRVFFEDNQPNGRVTHVILAKDGTGDETLKDVASFTKLRKLQLSSSKITGTGLKHLAFLKDLEELELFHCPIDDAGARELAALQSLKMLNISATKITPVGLKELAPLSRLEELRFEGTFGDSAAFVIAANLKQLKKLTFGQEVTDSGVAELAKMPNLRSVGFPGGPMLRPSTRVTDKGVAALCKTGMLEELHARHGAITDNTMKLIAQCKNLRILGLYFTNVTDVGLKELTGLTQLERLDLDLNRKISPAGIARFQEAHPNCKVRS
jgi:internalin A